MQCCYGDCKDSGGVCVGGGFRTATSFLTKLFSFLLFSADRPPFRVFHFFSISTCPCFVQWPTLTNLQLEESGHEQLILLLTLENGKHCSVKYPHVKCKSNSPVGPNLGHRALAAAVCGAAAHLGLSWEWRESAQRWECRCCCRHCSLDCRFPRCCHYREMEKKSDTVLSIHIIISEACRMHTVYSMWILHTKYINQNREHFEYCIPQCNLTFNVMARSTVIFLSTRQIRLQKTTIQHKMYLYKYKKKIYLLFEMCCK